MLELNSKNNQKIKDACALKMKKARLEKGLFLMEGIKNLDLALKYGNVKYVYIALYSNFKIKKIIKMLKNN